MKAYFIYGMRDGRYQIIGRIYASNDHMAGKMAYIEHGEGCDVVASNRISKGY